MVGNCRVKPSNVYSKAGQSRPTSDGIMYGGFEKRVGFEVSKKF